MRLFSHFLSLQHGAGGLLSPIELPSASNLLAWYDVDQETGFSDGDTLDPLSNQIFGAASESHFNIILTTTPTYQTNEIDSEPVAEFDIGQTDGYKSNENGARFFNFMHEAANSWLIVFTPENNTTDTSWRLLDNNNSLDLNVGFFIGGNDSLNSFQWTISNGTGTFIFNIAVNSSITFGNLIIAFGVFDGNNAELYIDNSSIGTAARVGSLSSSNAIHFLRLGRRSGSETKEFAGQVSQILLWNADVSSDRQALHDYFADRFPSLNL